MLLQITNNFYCMSRALAENCKRECNMVLIILVQGFVFNNITQFPDGFCLNTHMNNKSMLAKQLTTETWSVCSNFVLVLFPKIIHFALLCIYLFIYS